MNIKDIEKLINGDPDTLIKRAKELGIDFDSLDDDIARRMVRRRFSLTEQQFQAVDFVFWVAYLVEREAKNLIVYPEVQIGARQKAMETIVNKLHFGDKIKVIEELYTGKNDALIKLMRKIQDMRNDISHGRFDDLTYGGYHLSDNRGKFKLLANLRDVFLKKG